MYGVRAGSLQLGPNLGMWEAAFFVVNSCENASACGFYGEINATE